MKRVGVLILFFFLLAGCSFPTGLFFEPPPVDPLAAVNTPETPTPTSPPLPTDTPIPPTDIPCAYAWANNPLPDETALVMEELKKAGLNTVDAILTAYGENCIDTLHNKVIRFSVMQTDFFFNIPVADVRDKTTMGNMAAKVLTLAGEFPPGKVPGPKLGQCTLTFQDLNGQVRLNFGLDAAQKILPLGFSGEDLFNALSRP